MHHLYILEHFHYPLFLNLNVPIPIRSSPLSYLLKNRSDIHPFEFSNSAPTMETQTQKETPNENHNRKDIPVNTAT